ncbi:DUF4147 domain-containing protein [Ovoidimarina sediminis]|uniref:DUF4147 domain-containing protein n=1 Tax=Ovoidimarina sediminis TaxID=3079856 RepID=UPI0029137115|nr:DUF4147 domain-containing protein [Rhodophyticola sp. MJ-SS7]MDU8944037.1 DUF4147 domain-containing protein [Rhodophyticola sp. MJ-SS7]
MERLSDRETVERIWWAGVRAVQGEDAVRNALDAGPIDPPDRIIAVGKAAASMAAAASQRFPGVPCLVITKYDHSAGLSLNGPAEVIESAHPVPDAESLRAGARLLEVVSGLPADSHLLLLVSGGASALVEAPKADLTLDDIARENASLLAAGLDIHAMNARRKELSRIKGGGLLAAFPGARATVFAISDVEGDAVGVIGSGIGLVPDGAAYAHETRIIASNAIARAAAEEEARALGLPVLGSEETLYADIAVAAERILDRLDGTPGLRIFGGEPTTILPDAPGEGGRNQALALTLARGIAGRDGLTALVAGTDGSDGPTGAAGGVVTGETWEDTGAGHLARADSGPYLRAHGALFTTGPTGTNVMDLAIVLQR